jgi:hypothetical protein
VIPNQGLNNDPLHPCIAVEDEFQHRMPFKEKHRRRLGTGIQRTWLFYGTFPVAVLP